MNNNMNLFDLVAAFCRWCVKQIGNLWTLFTNSIRLALKYWYITIPVTLIFAAAGIYYSRPLNRIYKAEAIVYLNGPMTEDVKQVYKALEYNYPFFPNQEIENVLGLTSEQVNGLRRFEVFNVIDYLNDSTADAVDYRHKHKPTDTTNVFMPNVLCLQFRTKRPDMVPVIGEHILAYLNNNNNFQAAFEKKRALLERKSLFCHDQIEKLDSLTSAFYFQQAAGGAQMQFRWGEGMIMGKREIELFVGQILDFYNQTERVDRELTRCTAPVVTQQAFITCPKAVNGPIKCTAIGLIVGYVIACLVAFAVHRRRELKDWYNDLD